ncbi:hypothetical protein CQ13_29435 [Bradyrhizobium retamae]|uniref:Uncharacterized protein n=1 Tax=Bradyrhizobium retamae TaxID=1300035 RepID=A0A0R3MR35_9BRAD|nr:hypothetical protein [Bradyrhizobium retamae]KRR22379.1 hypothetical protein CQ13_29435 [Bradyrhizobium retamae]
MYTATALPEEAAIAIFLRLQDGTASFRMVFDKLRRRDAEIPRKTQDFVRADADRLVAATPIAGMTGVGKRTVTPHVEIDAGNQIAVGHDVAS